MLAENGNKKQRRLESPSALTLLAAARGDSGIGNNNTRIILSICLSRATCIIPRGCVRAYAEGFQLYRLNYYAYIYYLMSNYRDNHQYMPTRVRSAFLHRNA